MLVVLVVLAVVAQRYSAAVLEVLEGGASVVEVAATVWGGPSRETGVTTRTYASGTSSVRRVTVSQRDSGCWRRAPLLPIHGSPGQYVEHPVPYEPATGALQEQSMDVPQAAQGDTSTEQRHDPIRVTDRVGRLHLELEPQS